MSSCSCKHHHSIVEYFLKFLLLYGMNNIKTNLIGYLNRIVECLICGEFSYFRSLNFWFKVKFSLKNILNSNGIQLSKQIQL